MANIVVKTIPSATNITVQDSNNLLVNVQSGQKLNVNVTPLPTQTIQINRGVKGDAGPNAIGGYPINITAAQPQDVLMFGTNEWVNTPQTEIADGGNF
ncbi:hypothetical protein UFOVP746_51 [uncultured Caudovirales phage]|jgi:hypothetical protein|uniref:Uncharacterized protein n=1 Tax=uncultured Caudovirales phage TaxID=2100421 RepID=A0A6J7X4C4_9CAUD|nr:hypothetical protein UFOVP746_51 [uncultured Caudovirales phage]